MKNRETTTPNIDKSSSDEANLQLINEIILELKREIFKFTPIKRIFSDKKEIEPNLTKIVQNFSNKNQVTKNKT
jgi:hypothetical protein